MKATVYPVVIKTNATILLVAFVALVAITGVGGVTAVVACLFGLLSPQYLPLSVIVTAPSVIGLLALWFRINTTTVFESGRVTKSTLFSNKAVASADVRGYRRIGGTMHIRLVSRTAVASSISVPMISLGRAKDWFAAIPDLDAEDLAAVKKAFRDDPRYGATPADRKRYRNKLTMAANAMNWTAYSMVIWGLVFPVHILFAIGAAFILPFAGLALHRYARGYIRVDSDRRTKDGDLRPNIASALILPGFVLVLLSLRYDFLDVWRLTAWASAVVVGATLLLRAEVPAVRCSLPLTFLAILGAAAYGYGAVTQADIVLDAARPHLYRTTVEALSISHGRSTQYQVRVKTWGPDHIGSTMQVSSKIYAALHVGDEVCVRMGGGALAIRWYDLHDC